MLYKEAFYIKYSFFQELEQFQESFKKKIQSF